MKELFANLIYMRLIEDIGKTKYDTSKVLFHILFFTVYTNIFNYLRTDCIRAGMI